MAHALPTAVQAALNELTRAPEAPEGRKREGEMRRRGGGDERGVGGAGRGEGQAPPLLPHGYIPPPAASNTHPSASSFSSFAPSSSFSFPSSTSDWGAPPSGDTQEYFSFTSLPPPAYHQTLPKEEHHSSPFPSPPLSDRSPTFSFSSASPPSPSPSPSTAHWPPTYPHPPTKPTDTGPPARLWVGRLLPGTTREEVLELFRRAGLEGEVMEVEVRTQPDRDYDHAFVTLPSLSSASFALSRLQGGLVRGRRVSLELASAPAREGWVRYRAPPAPEPPRTVTVRLANLPVFPAGVAPFSPSDLSALLALLSIHPVPASVEVETKYGRCTGSFEVVGREKAEEAVRGLEGRWERGWRVEAWVEERETGGDGGEGRAGRKRRWSESDEGDGRRRRREVDPHPPPPVPAPPRKKQVVWSSSPPVEHHPPPAPMPYGYPATYPPPPLPPPVQQHREHHHLPLSYPPPPSPPDYPSPTSFAFPASYAPPAAPSFPPPPQPQSRPHTYLDGTSPLLDEGARLSERLEGVRKDLSARRGW
ncbi:hypothetical protein JCM8097_003864 [Rhodosporidiobolus ruineniae]